MKRCPICSTATDKQRAGTPYWECGGCGLLYQDPLPPKLFQHPSEYDLVAMPEPDKAANRALARSLFDNVMHGKPGATADIGAKWPFLAHYLAGYGCDAWSMEHEVIDHKLKVKSVDGDFERDWERLAWEGRYALITMVHVFEHMYDPTAALLKLRGLVYDGGHVFIRMPDSNVPGIERDFTEQHFAIHPFVHSLSSIAELCAITRAFVIKAHHELRPGQRDLILEPIA